MIVILSERSESKDPYDACCIVAVPRHSRDNRLRPKCPEAALALRGVVEVLQLVLVRPGGLTLAQDDNFLAISSVLPRGGA